MNLSTNQVSFTIVSADNLEKRLRKVKKDIGTLSLTGIGLSLSQQIIYTLGQCHMDGLRGLFDGQRKHIKGKDEQGRPFVLTFHGERDETYRYELYLDEAFDLKETRELRKKELLVHGDKGPDDATGQTRYAELDRSIQVFSKALADNLGTRSFDFNGEQAETHWRALASVLNTAVAQEPDNARQIVEQGLKDVGLEAHVNKALEYYDDKVVSGIFGTSSTIVATVELVRERYNCAIRAVDADHVNRLLAEFDAEFGDSYIKVTAVKQHPIFTFDYDAALAELRQIHAVAQVRMFEPNDDWTAFCKRQGLNDQSIQVLKDQFMGEYARSENRDAQVTFAHLLRRMLLSNYLTRLEEDTLLTKGFLLTLQQFSDLQRNLLACFAGTRSLAVNHPDAEQILDYLHPVHKHINAHLDYEATLAAPVIARPQSKETTMNPVTLTKAPRCDVIIPEVTEMVLVNLEPFGLSEHKDLVETYYRAALQAPTQEQAKMEIDALCSEFMDIGYENIDPFRYESYAMLRAVGKVFGEKPVNHPDTTHEPAVVTDRAIQGRTDVLDFFDMRKALFMERHWSLSRNVPKTNPGKFQIPAAVREQFPTLDLSKDEQRVALLHHYAAEVYSGEGAFDAACNYAGTDDAGHKYHISNGIQDVQLVVIWGNRITDLTLTRKQA